MSASRRWVRVGSYLLAGGTAVLMTGSAEASELAIDGTIASELQFASSESGEEGGESGEEGGESGEEGGESGEEGGESGEEGGESGEEGGESGEEGGESGEEGGESGEGGGLLESYSLGSTDPNAWQYDAHEEIEGYADLVHASYASAAEEARKLLSAVEGFLADPTEATLAEARNAWLNARPAYLETETFRFYDGPIDVDSESGEDGPEGRINAWPLNEAVIDYVEGAPDSGLVNDATLEIDRETILANDQVADEADVTTGWHAIEFLLWGQDTSATGPGDRPVADYLAGEGNNDRRRAYLLTVTQILVNDLEELEAQWAPGEDNYREDFLELSKREAIGRIVNGMAQLAGFELASERLAVALDSGMQEDEHSCFSDNTHIDHIHDLRGIRNVWFGSVGGQQFPGLIELAQRVDPVRAALVTARLNAAEAAVAALDKPFDRILAAGAGSPPRVEAERAVTALYDLAEALKAMGNEMGVLVIVGG